MAKKLKRVGGYSIFVAHTPWKDLGAMLQSIVNKVQKIGNPVYSSDFPLKGLIGFRMEQIRGDQLYSWEWEIKLEDLNHCLQSQEFNYLEKDFRIATGRVRIAQMLSEGRFK